MPDIWRVQGTASRGLPDDGLVNWAMRLALAEAAAAGARRMIVTHGDAAGGDKQMQRWALAEQAKYLAGRTGIAVVPDPHPADWEPWRPHCMDGVTGPRRRPGHRRRRRPGTATETYCPDAGHRRNDEMTALRPDRGLAFFQTGLPNRGTMDCALKMFHAGIPLWCFCTACHFKVLTEPCRVRDHQLREVTSRWFLATEGTLRV